MAAVTSNRQEANGNVGQETKPTVTPSSITLPRGGGAVKGIGEKFSVNPVTGTGSLTIPIFTSTGRSGFQPKLSLSYDSGSGNGPFGFGWHISAPSITRKTDKGLPRYFDGDSSDIFILSDAEDLMPVLTLQGTQWAKLQVVDRTWAGQTYSIERYRPRIEGLFARIERWRRQSDGDTHWRATTKDNVTSIYGLDPECRIADPADKTRVFKWLLEATFDAKGNVIYYRYKAEDATGVTPAAASERNRCNGNAPFTNAYLKRIHYGNLTPYQLQEDLAKRTDWLFEVVFDYGEHNLAKPAPTEDPGLNWATRADPFSNFRSTFDIRTCRLCQRVLMFHHFAKGQKGEAGYDGLVRSTDFSYDKSDPNSSLLGNPIATKLLAITQTGYKLDATGASYIQKSFPPIEFTYSEAAIDPTVRTVDPASLANAPAGLDGSNYRWLDLDGEGLAGIFTQQNGAMFYKRNNSPINIVQENGTPRTQPSFAPVELVASQPASTNSGAKLQFMDLAADGHRNLVSLESPVRGYYGRTEDSGWDGFRPFPVFPGVDMRDPNLKMLDVDGDGLTDLLVSEDEVFSWYRSLGYDGFDGREYARKPFDEELGAALVFNDPTQSIFLADMTGDGLTDIVRIRNGEVCYWPNRGYGRFGAKVTMDNSPCFDTPDIFDPRRIRLADMDGSGTTDILYLAARGVAIYHNQSGNSWSDEITLPNFPFIDNVASADTIDLLGNGTACLVWSSPLASDYGHQMRYIDLMGGEKPHLLTGVRNNMGAETRVRYAPSTKFYVQDREAGTPWVTRLGFPVHVVERAEVFDYIGRTRVVSTYRYRHGYFDGVEREFRGFGYVEQRDAESFGDSGNLFTEDTDTEADALHAPPVVTKTWFHTGAWPDEETIIQHMAHEYYSAPSEGALLPDTIFPTDVFVLDPAQPDGTNRIPYSLTGEELREAVRALKGSILRQEIYADDGSAKAAIPYSVSERNYTIECLQPQGDNRYAVFFTHERETIDYHHERNPLDPRVTHNAVLKVDPFGNIRQSITIAYGRNLSSAGVPLAPPASAGPAPDLTIDLSTFAHPEQTTALIILTDSTYTTAQPVLANNRPSAIDDPDDYRTPMPSETCIYELTRPARPDDSVVYSFADLQALVAAAVEISYEVSPDLSKAQKRLINHTRTLYLKDDLSGPLPFGQMDTLGLVFETYKLALTASLAEEIFITGNSNPNKPADAAALNAILSSVGDTDSNGIFTSSGGSYVNSQGDGNWWVPSGQIMYSPVPQNPASLFVQDATYAAAHFYLPQAHRDPFGQYTRLTYDSYDLLLEQSQDALNNIVTAQNDYRVLQPFAFTDPNQNQTEVRFDVLGMPVGTAIEGKITGTSTESGDSFAKFNVDLAPSDIEGFISNPNPITLALGLLGTATSRIIYDLDRFRNSQVANPTDPTQWEPVFTATIARETHGDAASKVQVSFNYSDGLGREIQKKAQAESGPVVDGGPTVNPRWVGSGWMILNNKSKPIRQYEPFFSASHRFEFANKVGVTPTLFYDPLERVIATLHPDHTWEKVVFDPWLQKSWDVNDTVQFGPKTDPDVGALFNRLPDADHLPTWYQTRIDPALAAAAFPDTDIRAAELDAANKTAVHNDTPSAAIFDVLGRPFLAVARNRITKNGGTVDEFYSSRTELDIEGNQLSVTDALGRIVMRYDYDMLGNHIHQASMEAGERWLLNDVVGKPIYAWDNRSHHFRTSYDALRRALNSFLRDGSNNEIVIGQSTYGESQPNPEQNNLRGKVIELRDQAGILTTGEYDFKGNLLRSSRQLVQDYKNEINWLQSPALEAETFVTSATYDALNRPVTATSPDNSVYRPTFNEANFLETIDVNLQGIQTPTSFVTNIDYDAKGQRVLIEYGNNVRTQYRYDPLTFRLVELITTRGTDNAVLQYLSYAYDPAGNITKITDRAQQTIYFNNQVVTPSNDYTYDAIYRLIKALGREHLGQTGGVPNAPTPQSYNDWPNINLPHPNDGQAMGNYIENFLYDPVGNIQQLQHIGTQSTNPGWTRDYAYQEPSQLEPGKVNNRLTSTTIGGSTETYSSAGDGYDAHGNMLRMPQLQIMQWNFKDQLQMTQRQRVNNDDVDGTQHQGERTYYVYDAAGQRTRKVTESLSGTKSKERIYLGVFEIYREYTGANAGLERQTLHVMDDKQRVAMIETRNNANDGTTQQLNRYQLGNHLGSACLELNDQAQVISYEEYYPYGSTSYQAVGQNLKPATKRYRYLAMERDEESGLNYHTARYFAPWLGRWTSCDPSLLVDGDNLFQYARADPIILTDRSGHDAKHQRLGASLERASKRHQDIVNKRRVRSGLQKIDVQRQKGVGGKRGIIPDEVKTLPHKPEGGYRRKTVVELKGRHVKSDRNQSPSDRETDIRANLEQAKSQLEELQKAGEITPDAKAKVLRVIHDSDKGKSSDAVLSDWKHEGKDVRAKWVDEAGSPSERALRERVQVVTTTRDRLRAATLATGLRTRSLLPEARVIVRESGTVAKTVSTGLEGARVLGGAFKFAGDVTMGLLVFKHFFLIGTDIREGEGREAVKEGFELGDDLLLGFPSGYLEVQESKQRAADNLRAEGNEWGAAFLSMSPLDM